MHLSKPYTSLPKLVQIGPLYHIASMGTIGRRFEGGARGAIAPGAKILGAPKI